LALRADGSRGRARRNRNCEVVGGRLSGLSIRFAAVTPQLYGQAPFAAEGTLLEKQRNQRLHHKTTLVVVGDQSAQIDVELAGVIELLWKLDINTRGCCQNESETLSRATDDPRGYIGFELVEDLQRFLELFADSPVADHRWQNFAWAGEVGGPVIEVPPIGWTYRINVRRPGPNRERIEIGASVRFPVGDIPLIETSMALLG
jgi:hypothetical protein